MADVTDENVMLVKQWPVELYDLSDACLADFASAPSLTKHTLFPRDVVVFREGVQGPVDDLRPAHRDPYFVEWAGLVAWHPPTCTLYCEPAWLPRSDGLAFALPIPTPGQVHAVRAVLQRRG